MANSTLTAIGLLLQQSTIISLLMGIYVIWREKRVNYFSLLMISCALWAFAYANEIVASSLEAKILWAKVEYIGIATVPVFWLIYILQYTQHRNWVTVRNIVLSLIIPIITIVAVWTNEFHLLFWTDNAITRVGEALILENSYGVFFWLHTAYSYSIMLAGSFWLLNFAFYYSHQPAGRIFIILLATAAPWISNILFLAGIIPYIDTTPIAFTVTGILMIVAIGRRANIVLPVAYQVAMRALPDGIALLNSQQIITSVNPAMAKLLSKTMPEIVGQDGQAVFGKEVTLANEPTGTHIIIPIDHEYRRYLKIQVSPVLSNKQEIDGYVIVAEDITERKQAEDNMHYMLGQIETIKKEWEITADSLDQLICLIDDNGNVRRANLAIENWGLESVTHAKGQGLSSLLGRVYPDLAETVDNKWTEIVESLQQGFPHEFDVEDKQLGHFFEVRFEPLRQYTQSQSATGSFAVTSISDVTKRKHLERDLERALKLAELEHQKSESLLLNILPQPIAERLKEGDNVIADSIDEVTVLFADIVGFTKLASRISATDLVQRLNSVFSKFDELAFKHGLEKIKTIGDAYMIVGGLPLPMDNHAETVALMALDMQEAIAEFSEEFGEPLSIRVGIHSGSVVAGVIGTKKFAYDLWGDTVNVASRMESHGVEGAIQVSSATYEYLRKDFELEERGVVYLKNKGEMLTYLLTGVAQTEDVST